MIGSTCLTSQPIGLAGGTITSSQLLGSGTATSTVSVSNTGVVSASGVGASVTNTVPTEGWGLTGGYVMASGDPFATGTMNTWVAVTTTPSWSVSRSTLGSITNNIRLSFSTDSAGGYVYSEVDLTMKAVITSL